jgi:hypothetical protein
VKTRSVLDSQVHVPAIGGVTVKPSVTVLPICSSGAADPENATRSEFGVAPFSSAVGAGFATVIVR